MEKYDSARNTDETAGVIAPPPLIFLGAYLAALALERQGSCRKLPEAARAIGLLSVFLSGALGPPSILEMRNKRTAVDPYRPSRAIVTSGPYAVSRNPIYLAMTLLYTGSALIFRKTLPLVTLPAALALVHWGVILREEHYLDRRFGEEYQNYRRVVRRWI